MGIALSTLGSGIGDNLPMVIERLAFRQSRNHHGDEGNGKKVADELKHILKGTSPYLGGETPEELGYGKLGRPNTVCR